MAEETARAFARQDIAIIEAGTGTGKTLAYLTPAVMSGLKTIVSTGTKNLQEQIFHKDIPFMQRRLGGGFKAAYLKGRENYLCLFQYKAFLQQPVFTSADESSYFDYLRQWVEATGTGDRAELTELPEDFFTWADLSASADRCLGGKCPDYQDCFLSRARRAAAAADLVVVNHHLFMADLAVRGGGHGEVIPEYEAVIFDEAHQLEDVATQHFGVEVSSWRLARLRRDAETVLKAAGRLNGPLARSLTALSSHADVLAAKFFPRDGEYELWADADEVGDRLREHGANTLSVLEDLASGMEAVADNAEEIDALAGRAREIARELGRIMEGRDSDFVFFAEKRGRGLFLRAAPIDVAPFLRERLLEQGRPLVFTSATLTAEGEFDYFKDRLGLFPEIDGLVVESPFDLEKNTLLYVPASFPSPGDAAYLAALTAEIDRLLSCSRGRAFLLFTSYRNLNHVARRLEERLPWTCLVQGRAPRTALLEQFRTDTSSVLFATHSFWQGVDVPGESLSAVIIDKLPFPRPDRPLVRARAQRLRDEGRDPFMEYSAPEAVITLKQGLGRLIRTTTDRGLLAVLDSRLVRKGYGRKFLASLPHSPLTHDLDEVREFFRGA